MDDIEHYMQDSCELLAVAKLQRLAEEAGLATQSDSNEKFAAYDAYRLDPRRNVDESLLSARHAAMFATYKSSLDTHLPDFFRRLKQHFPGETFSFVDVERDARNEGGSEDFLIVRSGGDPVRMSLKNYRGTAARPQVKSGTWNSFVVNFLFEGAGSVGMALHPVTGEIFKGSDRPKRDAAIEALGLSGIIPLVHELDGLNDEIRATFLEDDLFEFFDKERFAAACNRFGLAAVGLAERILHAIGDARVKARVLTLAGLDEGDEVLLMDPVRCADSLTDDAFRSIRLRALDPASTITFEPRGQSLNFWITDSDGGRILPVDVPFTINSNGAWWRDGEPFEGTREKSDKGHVLQLRYGQRRPYKSRELATSVNTYLDLGKAGIFRSDAV
jgi:hypothetical protein